MSYGYSGTPAGPISLPGLLYANSGAKIIPVHHSGPGNLDDAPAWFSEEGRTTVQAALSLCRTGRGDIIQLLPGHTETVTAADAWSNLAATGVTILGPQFGPPATITWSAATTTVLFDTSGLVIDGGPKRNITLNMDPGSGTVNVAAPITISATYCGIRNCRIRMGTDSNSKVTVGILLTDAADDCHLVNNQIYGATAAEATTLVDIAGADRLYMADNTIQGATSSTTVGVVRFKTTAATNIVLVRNFYANRKASSVHAVTGVASVTGYSYNELFHMLDDSATVPWGTSTGSMAFYNPRNVNLAGEMGMLSTVVST